MSLKILVTPGPDYKYYLRRGPLTPIPRSPIELHRTQPVLQCTAHREGAARSPRSSSSSSSSPRSAGA